MRSAAFALALLSLPALAEAPARTLTVSQLEALLHTAHSHHSSDTKIARQISAIQLSERISDPALLRLQAILQGDPQSATALRLLADQSLFLKPSAGEITDTSIPDSKALHAMMAKTSHYIDTLITSLPNLLATRTTTSYSDAPNGPRFSFIVAFPTLRKVATNSIEISLRNDSKNEGSKDPKAARRKAGMSSWGEFGSLLATVLIDAAHGKIFWSRWEPSATGQLAVFDFSVPKSASHYVFDDFTGTTRPGYRGSLWINPTTGVVDRLYLELEQEKSASYVSFRTMVQYGPIPIDEKIFYCPVRSLAVEEIPPPPAPIGYSRPGEAGVNRWVNETTFTNYHRFESTFKIITSPDLPAIKNQDAKPPE